MDEFHHQWHGQLEIVADFEKTAVWLPPGERATSEHPPLVAVGLRVRNMSDVPLVMSFPSTQLFEIELCDERGEVHTSWGQDKMFAQVASERTLDPHRSWYLEGDLPLADLDGNLAPSGNYTIRVRLCCNMHIAAQAPLRLLRGE